MKISEAAVFRWVVIVGVAAVSVIALTLLTSPLVGALWGLLLVLAGALHAYRWWKARSLGSRRPAVATVHSIASQVTVARATWTQTISPGSSRAHWTPPTTPCRASRPITAVSGRRARLVAAGAAQEEPDGDRGDAEDRGDRRVALDDPFQRPGALEGEAVDELALVGAGVRAGGGRDRADEDRQLAERDQRPDRPDAEPVAGAAPLPGLVARAPGEREGGVEQQHREDEVAHHQARERGGT